MPATNQSALEMDLNSALNATPDLGYNLHTAQGAAGDNRIHKIKHRLKEKTDIRLFGPIQSANNLTFYGSYGVFVDQMKI